MSSQRPTEGESGNGGYPYDNNNEYGDGEQQQYPYPSQYHSQYQQYSQQPPRQPSPQQYSYQQSKISSFQQSSSVSYSDEEGTGQSHVHKDGWLFRPPENGHVITKGEIASRIIQYYEVSS